MGEAAIDPSECEQRLNAIYAWSRLLQIARLDEDSRARALQAIQNNTERLLTALGGRLKHC